MRKRPQQAEEKKFSIVHGIAFSPSQMEAIKRQAAKERRSLNFIVRRAVDLHLGLDGA